MLKDIEAIIEARKRDDIGSSLGAAEQILEICEPHFSRQERKRIIKYLDEANDIRELDWRFQALKEE